MCITIKREQTMNTATINAPNPMLYRNKDGFIFLLTFSLFDSISSGRVIQNYVNIKLHRKIENELKFKTEISSEIWHKRTNITKINIEGT